MVGFVGIRAKKRKRNKIIFLVIVILSILLFFYLPTFQIPVEEKQLPKNILPNENIDETSLVSEIEELKLEIFQKNQRIKFRDNQINSLKDEIKNINQSFLSLQNEYKKNLSNYSELENSSSKNSLENVNEIKILQNKINQLNSILKKYENQVIELTNKIKSSFSEKDFEEINIKNSILKNEIKLFKEKNYNYEIMLKNLESIIDEKEKEIEKLLYLKDQKHHG